MSHDRCIQQKKGGFNKRVNDAADNISQALSRGIGQPLSLLMKQCPLVGPGRYCLPRRPVRLLSFTASYGAASEVGTWSESGT